MKALLILMYLLLNSIYAISQIAGTSCNQSPCTCVFKNISDKNWSNAKYYIDRCIESENAAKHAKAWLYRGIIYQNIYENYDTTFKVTKDSALIISMISYLETFCVSVISDTLNSNKLLNDSLYRSHKINLIDSYWYSVENFNLELKKYYLPHILELLEGNSSIDIKTKMNYSLTFEQMVNKIDIIK